MTVTKAGASAPPPALAGAVGSGIAYPHAFQGAALGSTVDAPPIAPLHRHPWLTDITTDPTVAFPAVASGAPTEIAGSGAARALAATDATIFRTTAVNGAPRNFADEVLEPSIATNGSTIFVT